MSKIIELPDGEYDKLIFILRRLDEPKMIDTIENNTTVVEGPYESEMNKARYVIGDDKFNINKFETINGCYLAVTSTDCRLTDVNVSFEDTVQTLYDKLTDDDKDTSCFPSGCTVSAEESDKRIYTISKEEFPEGRYLHVSIGESSCRCRFADPVKILWGRIEHITS